jgi:hypothetical protein
VESYSGSGQSWLDMSGNGYDFFRGTTSGAQASDPTFNGTAGNLTGSEYWGFDGGDVFTYDTTHETWMQNLHKNNAKLTLACWVYSPTLAGGIALAGNNSAETLEVGFNFNVRSTSVLRFGVTSGSGAALNMDSTATMSDTAWTFLAASLDEATSNSGIMQVGATQETGKACAYTSPSASNASFTTQLACLGDSGAVGLVNGSRMSMFTAWEGVALTAAQLQAIYDATRARHGV